MGISIPFTNEVNIYIDGILDASKVIPALETGLDTCFIGHGWVNGSRQGHLGVGIDELSFWSRPLSLAEIQDDMANGTDSTDTDLAYFYNFEEGQGNSVHDISPTTPLANSQFENADSTAVWVDGAPRYRGQMSNQVVIHFTNNPLQIVQINSSATALCAGDSLILEAECRSFDVVSSYQWSSGQSNGMAFVPSQSAYYKVTATDALGCKDVDSIQITINAAPTIQLAASDTAVCLGESVSLTASGADSYLWNNSVQNAQPFQPAQSAYYTVVATDNSSNCSASDSLWLSVYSLPNVSLQPSASAICAGDSVQIQAPTSLTYSWPQGLANGQNFAPDSTDDYTVIGTDANGCRDTATTTIVVNSLPQVQLHGPANNGICFGESMILSASGASSYSWDNGVVDGQSFTPQSAQSYTVTATDANGCENTASIFVDVFALPAVSIAPDLSLSNPNQLCPGDSLALFGAGGTSYSWSQLKVYPNPSHNEVYIDLSDLEQQPLQLRLYNLMGQLVLQEEQMGGRLASLSMADLPAGTYILQLQQANEQIQLTVVKQ
ncbi:T9SS type A sorting domain-containing protein [Saprospira grandis]|uniref:T9SS type A sorting domain-containing protein n=1 Tax=Saprospira grandis TaxID=1008 RepID=UPI0022DD1725|nr:T9SS type A sorting domain-containing protein [Saprospira grandis]WBM75388.1 T9SS type A sorting domain-containing protein [Saprospira grandis]